MPDCKKKNETKNDKNQMQRLESE